MHCPFCPNEETQVVDSRVSEDGRAVRRRRRCEKCDKRFTTYERIELSMPTLVKKDGSRVDYSRDKILGSMRLALRKRPVSSEALEAAIAQLEEKVIGLGEKEVPTSRIGELVMRELKKLDKVSYIRYASVYRSFEDIESFESALKELR
jgi:transcriptional repressor NrdR